MALNLPPNFSDPFTLGLACAALHPGLRSILVYNSPPLLLREIATVLSQMLREVMKSQVYIVNLGANETEDDLWGTLALHPQSNDSSFIWRPGRLACSPNDRRIRLVIIPNLAQLSLPAARACVTLMGTEVAYLERHGQDISWSPNICWLAGCARSDLGQVTPHLLDRFALRLSETKERSTNRASDLLAWVYDPSFRDDCHWISMLSSSQREHLGAAALLRPELDPSMVAQVFEYFSEPSPSGSRREIALAYLAIALAQMMGSTLVTATHVNEAASLIELQPKFSLRKNLQTRSEPHLEKFVDMPMELQTPSGPSPQSVSTGVPISTLEGTPVYSSKVQETFIPAPLSGPYLEDSAPVDREVFSLQLPPRRYQTTAASYGPIIGTERSTSLHDLAIVSTLLEAAKFQTVRRKYSNMRPWSTTLTSASRQSLKGPLSLRGTNPNRLLISSADLRCYRRSPIPEQMLVLVLDYTCLRDCDWEEALLPHLQWAYTARASICLIQVGTATATGIGRLRAQKIVAPSILAPSIRNAFEMGPGCSTPLAHGLDLALYALRTAMQHGRSAVHKARFVVLSDGRGNVPLEASRTGTIKLPVDREGIEDALQVARCLRGMKNVEAFLLNPQPQQYPDLPIALAEALGVVPDAIRLRDAGGLSDE